MITTECSFFKKIFCFNLLLYNKGLLLKIFDIDNIYIYFIKDYRIERKEHSIKYKYNLKLKNAPYRN